MPGAFSALDAGGVAGYMKNNTLQARSSGGEHYLDTVGVPGSNPGVPTRYFQGLRFKTVTPSLFLCPNVAHPAHRRRGRSLPAAARPSPSATRHAIMTARIIINPAMAGSGINYGVVSNCHLTTEGLEANVAQPPGFIYPPVNYSPVRMHQSGNLEIFGGGFGGRDEIVDGPKAEGQAGRGHRLCAHAATGQEPQAPF